MAHVRQHGPRRRVRFRGEVYEWPDSGVLEVPDQAARALVRAHKGLTLDDEVKPRPRVHHDPEPPQDAGKPKGKPEDPAESGG